MSSNLSRTSHNGGIPHCDTPAACVATRSSGEKRATTSTVDNDKLPAALKKLLPGGTGGRGSSDPRKWNFMTYKRQKVDLEPEEQQPSPQKSRQLFEERDDREEASFNPSSRSIIENNTLSELIRKHCVCRFCHGELHLTFPAVCIATIPTLSCTKCSCTAKAEIRATTLPRSGHVKMTDYVINTEFVGACISCGDGGAEAGRILGLLDLPNSASMEKTSFSKIESGISEAIQGVSQEALDTNLVEEVRLSMDDDPEFEFQNWNNAVSSGVHDNYPLSSYAKISISCDMGWQKRSSGRSYSSTSGYEFLIGMKTKKPIAVLIRSKFCRICSFAKSKNQIVRQHTCTVNHEGSSGSMESAALVEMTHELHYSKLCHLQYIVTDDDSTMKARLKWSNADYERHYGEEPKVMIEEGKKKGQYRIRKDNGQLDYPIPEPKFVADPAHRIKTFRNHLYTFKGLPAEEKFGFNDADLTRIVRNFAYFVRKLPQTSRDEWVDASKAVIDHHFDEHSCCGDFCQRKKTLQDSSADTTNKFYRCRNKEPKLYAALKNILAAFVHQKSYKRSAMA